MKFRMPITEVMASGAGIPASVLIAPNQVWQPSWRSILSIINRGTHVRNSAHQNSPYIKAKLTNSNVAAMQPASNAFKSIYGVL